jgi:CheY-like chemotaxis protein
MTTPVRVLIAEDERIIAIDLGRRMARLGHTVVANVRSGPEAISAAADAHPDLLLIDLQLAGPLTGREVAAQICAERPIPVIFLSGRAASADPPAEDFPCPEFFLAKPFSDPALAATIAAAMADPPA